MKKVIVLGATLFLPLVVFAQSEVVVNVTQGVSGLVGAVQGVINVAMPLIVVIAVIVVIWGAFQIILGASDEEARKSGRSKILWGLVGVFLALSAWALVAIVINSLSVTGAGTVNTGNFDVF